MIYYDILCNILDCGKCCINENDEKSIKQMKTVWNQPTLKEKYR